MFPVKDEYSGPMDFLEVGYGEGEPPDKPLVTHDEQRKKNVNAKAKCEQCGEEFQFSFQGRYSVLSRDSINISIYSGRRLEWQRLL